MLSDCSALACLLPYVKRTARRRRMSTVCLHIHASRDLFAQCRA